MAEWIDLLAAHYEKTYETTLKVWEQRNWTFLILLAVGGNGDKSHFRRRNAVEGEMGINPVSTFLRGPRAGEG